MQADALTTAIAGLDGRARQLFDALYEGTRDPAGGVTRDSYGAGEQFAHDLVAGHARALGLEVTHDDSCNTYMTWPGRNRGAPAIVIGSHLDSVAQGGNFDGAAGVIAGLVALEALQAAGFQPACDLVVMGVRAEESAWFRTSYVGSRGALGMLEPEALQARRVDTGRTLEEHLHVAGGDPESLRQGRPALTRQGVRAFFEVHIEQAPALEAASRAVGIGTAIPGNARFPHATIAGEYAHVGTPRRFRRDAALAAADFAVALDELWARWEAAGRPMACTIGEFSTDRARHAMTKVAGDFAFSLDLRAYEQADVQELEAETLRLVREIEARRGVTFALGRRTAAGVAKADPELLAQLEACASAAGIATMRIQSPASHDAAAFCAAGIPFGFVFIRNAHGSHHPGEDMRIEDFVDATSVVAHWLMTHAAATRD